MPLTLTEPVSACKLWIDGVGCWWVCFEDRVTIGNPIPVSGSTKISVVADLGTKHATVNFEDASYWISGETNVSLDGGEVHAKQSMCHGTVLTLGSDVQLRFEQSSSLSLTSTLAIESGHRFADGVDGVVLFQKTCLLGTGKQKHICCGDWSEDVILFERDKQLFCKTAKGKITLDGIPHDRIVKVHDGARLEGGDWSMRVEAV